MKQAKKWATVSGRGSRWTPGSRIQFADYSSVKFIFNLDLLPGGKKKHLRKKPEYAIAIRSLTGIAVLPSRGT